MLRRFQLTQNAALSPEERGASATRPAARGGPVGGAPDGRTAVIREAVLFATAPAVDDGPAAALPVLGTTVLGRLLDQLQSLRIGHASVITRPGWKAAVEGAAAQAGADVAVVTSEDVAQDLRLAAEISAEARGTLLVASAHVVTHREALAGLLADPRIVSGVLAAGTASRAGWSFPIRSQRARLVSAASPYHRVKSPTGYFLGLMKIDARDRLRLVEAAEALSELVGDRPSSWDGELERKALEWRLRLWRAAVERETGAPPDPAEVPEDDSVPLDAASEADVELRRRVAADDPVSLLLVGLVRNDVELFPSNLRGFFYATPFSTEAAGLAGEELERVDEDRVLLDSAVKGNDGFFTTYFVSPYSKYLARFAARRGWTPNAVSTTSLVIGAAAAASFALGSRASLIAGAILLQISFTVDCVDGQLARYTRTFSKLGAWLDSVFDRTKEYLVYAGLALGASRGFGQDVWLLAAAALALQTVRHMTDFSYWGTQRQGVASAVAAPLERPEDLPVDGEQAPRQLDADATPRQRLVRRAVALAAALRRSSLLSWANRIVRLPIGERFALISLTAAIASPRATFIALLAWGGVAALYALGARLLISYSVPRRLVRAVLK